MDINSFHIFQNPHFKIRRRSRRITTLTICQQAFISCRSSRHLNTVFHKSIRLILKFYGIHSSGQRNICKIRHNSFLTGTFTHKATARLLIPGAKINCHIFSSILIDMVFSKQAGNPSHNDNKLYHKQYTKRFSLMQIQPADLFLQFRFPPSPLSATHTHE